MFRNDNLQFRLSKRQAIARSFSAALQVSDAKTCVMIGDCLRVDIARANELDFASILISPENSSREDTLRDSVQPDLIIPSLLSLLDSQEQQDSSSLAIEDESIRIRETRDSDLKFVLDAENDIENSPFVVSWSMDQHRESLGNSDVGHLIIENVKTTCPVGYAIVRGLAAANGPIELKRLVITEKRMGHGRATLTLLKELVFKRLGRARFWLNVLPHNRRALDLYHSTGFRYEGTWRDSYPTDSVHLDLILMTSLATDDFENRSLEFSGKSVKVVRQFSQRQLAQYCELYDLEWPNNTRTHDDLVRGLLGAKFAIGITEEESDDLIAICSVISDREFRAWIHGVIVRKDHRGIGLGKLLMEQVLSSFETQHYHHICLTCAPGMTDFYSRWGFKVWKDEAVMKLLLREPTTDS